MLLTRHDLANVDVLRSRIIVETAAIQVGGKVSLGQEPRTRPSKRTVPVARSVVRRLEQHLADHVGAEPDALVVTASRGGPIAGRPSRARPCRPAGREPRTASPSTGCGTASILVAAGCNVREVSEWAGHHNVALTLTRYGGLFEDGSDEAVDRLDALLQTLQGRTSVSELRRR